MIKNSFPTDQRGSVSVMGASFMLVLFCGAAVALQSSSLYALKLRSQRTADLASLAASNTTTPVVNGAPSATAVATAANVAAINGFSSATVTTTAGTSPTNDGNNALKTVITQTPTLMFGSLFLGKASATVGGTAQAEVETLSAGICLASLLAPVNIYENASVTGSTCDISADTYLYVCGSANVSVNKVAVGYSSSAESPYICSSASMSPAAAKFSYGTTTTDTIATNTSIVALKDHLLAMENPGWPYGTQSPASLLNPVVSSGTDKTYTSTAATLSSATKYGNVTATNSTLTFTGSGFSDTSCVVPTTISGNLTLSGTNTLTFSSGCYVIGNFTLISGNATFAVAAGASVTFVFKNDVDNGSGTATFGDGTYSFNNSVNNTSGGTLSFGNGTKVFGNAINNGTGSLTFGNGPSYINGGTITNEFGSLTFGTGPFYLWGGSISNWASATMTFGAGTFYFYGGSIYNTGTMSFGNGPYYFQGGSLMLYPSSTTQFGVGNMDFYGGSIGLYGKSVIFGYGGSAQTGSSTISFAGGSLSWEPGNLTATGVTFGFYGGSVSLYGTGTLNATAPTSANPAYGYQNVLFAIWGGAFNLYQTGNPADTLSGLIYAPQGDSSIYLSETVTYPTGGCLELVSGTVDVYENASLSMAPCAGLSVTNSTSSAPVLVQ